MARIQNYQELDVNKLTFHAAMRICEGLEGFSAEEKSSLTDQIRRSSRSVAANVAEAWPKRRFPKSFVRKLIDSAGEATEAEFWLDLSVELGYLNKELHADLKPVSGGGEYAGEYDKGAGEVLSCTISNNVEGRV